MDELQLLAPPIICTYAVSSRHCWSAMQQIDGLIAETRGLFYNLCMQSTSGSWKKSPKMPLIILFQTLIRRVRFLEPLSRLWAVLAYVDDDGALWVVVRFCLLRCCLGELDRYDVCIQAVFASSLPWWSRVVSLEETRNRFTTFWLLSSVVAYLMMIIFVLKYTWAWELGVWGFTFFVALWFYGLVLVLSVVWFVVSTSACFTPANLASNWPGLRVRRQCQCQKIFFIATLPSVHLKLNRIASFLHPGTWP